MDAPSLFRHCKSHFLRSCDLNDVLTGESECACALPTGSKVVATIGPACHEVDTLKALLSAGAIGARVDLTWGPLEFHHKSLYNLQVAMRDCRRMCCTMVDTLGRELMIRRQCKMDEHGWPVHEESYTVTAGQRVVITTRADVEATSSLLPISYEGFTDMAEKGDTIYIGRYLACGADQASLYLEVESVDGQDVVCVAKNDAVLSGLLTVFHTERSFDTLLNVQNELPLLADYDKSCIETLARDFEIDFISLSYTRSAEDVRECRTYLDSIGLTTTKILAKVETRQSLLNFQDILAEADGIIISRGNLGLDCLPEKMALVQKTLIQACNIVGKPVLITRVVDTMVNTPRPTRAEATDVANAVLDGCDGILLGAETLRGQYPVESVRTICQICRSAERVFDYRHHFEHLMEVAVESEDLTGRPARVLLHGAAGHAHHHPESDSADEDVDEDGEDSGSMRAAMNDGVMHADRSSGTSSAAGDTEAPKLVTASDAKGSPALPPPSGKAKGSATAPAMATAVSFDSAADHVAAKHAGPRGKGKGGMHKVGTYGGGSLAQAAHAMADALPLEATFGNVAPHHGRSRTPLLSKLESIASSAVRAADKVAASLIVVYTHTGSTAQLVAKYRPPMPIMTLVVPHLTSDGLRWVLRGRAYARQCLLSRGLLPMLAAPSSHGEQILEEAIASAAGLGLVKALNHVVVVQRVHDDFCVKIITVDATGRGIRKLDSEAEAGSMPHGAGAVVQFPATSPSFARGSLYHRSLFSAEGVTAAPIPTYQPLPHVEGAPMLAGGIPIPAPTH